MRVRTWYFLLVLVLPTLSPTLLWAGESAVLAGGARLHVDRHETDGGKIRLYTGDGFVELNATLVKGFEQDEAVAAAAPAVPPAAAAATVQPVLSPQDMADRAADKYGLPRKLVRAVMAAESGFSSQAVSRKGAIGLMQLMPATAQTLGVDPEDPAQNVDGGARYLRDLLAKYDGFLWHTLAAYNAGPAAVDRYNGIPPYAETIEYVKRIDAILKKSGD
jgi:soluble lytic murein transglycosylase-like protein